MAYPTVSGPYGFQPINRVDGMPYAGATRTYAIASNYNTPIFNGDLVILVTGGTIEKFTGTNSGFPLGVFMGCEFTNAQGQRLNGQYYAGTSMTNATARLLLTVKLHIKSFRRPAAALSPPAIWPPLVPTW